ncbi:hypothetical protein D9757_004494 [Collybiopsis confluens]|uniref:Uncharacterized protein n=1 Tax=Collybiopsis confluens TaxID=2823264 RepID=A0A8H5HWS6_9AGAR|nr:hypothetical protein D9757_004494 [Collybiopsis confluens]
MAEPETSDMISSSPQTPSKMKRSSSSPSFIHKSPAIASVASSLLTKVRRRAQALSPIHTHSRRPSDSSVSEDEAGEQPSRITTSPEPYESPSTPTKNTNIRRKSRTSWTCSSSEPPPLPRTSSDSRKERMEYKDTFVCMGGVNLPLLLRLTKSRLVEDAENRAGIGMGFGSGKKVVLDNERWSCTISGPPPPIPPTLSPPSSPRSPTSPMSASMAMLPPATSRTSSLSSNPFSSRRDSSTSLPSRKYKVHIHYTAYAFIIDAAAAAAAAAPSEPPLSPIRSSVPDCHQPVELDRAREGCVRGLMTIVNRKEPGP